MADVSSNTNRTAETVATADQGTPDAQQPTSTNFQGVPLFIEPTVENIDRLMFGKEMLSKFLSHLSLTRKLLDQQLANLQNMPLYCKMDLAASSGCFCGGTPVSLREKLYAPVDKYPGYNFLGRLFGPRGTTIRELEKETGCRITVVNLVHAETDANIHQGNWTTPSEQVAVLIEVEDTMSEARAKLQRATSKVSKILTPPPFGKDWLKSRQLRELAMLNGTYKDRRADRSTQRTSMSSAPPQTTDRRS
ncbi:unnamed protein product [Soboliphyme baturini]|uniref:KH domain-containing protein n=1 Tax=Soboliphyme baturini TaxID=241478 RepID=A0A183I9C7_9BILA|nr:unnamed protein product [Soboliphyme baturini]